MLTTIGYIAYPSLQLLVVEYSVDSPVLGNHCGKC